MPEARVFSATKPSNSASKSRTRWISIAVALAAVVAGFSAQPAQAVDGSVQVNCSTSGTFTVRTSGTSVVATSGSNCVGEAQIPAEVTTIDSFAFANNNRLTSVTFSGSSLTGIGQYAFFNTGLTSLVIPSGVTYIDYEAFMYVGGLASLTFAAGSHLQTLGTDAFKGISSLTSVTIPSTVTSIGADCFRNDSHLTSLTFAAASVLTSISNGAFVGTAISAVTLPPALQNFSFAAFADNTSFTVDSGNPYITFQNGVMFSSDMTILKGYPSSAAATSYSIPSSVTTIGANAFQNAQFTSVTIPSSVTSIGSSAFNASRLTSVTIPASVATIGTYAFNEVPNLQSVTFAPGSATTFLSNGSFQNLTHLTALDFGIGSHLVTIDAQAFRGSNLTSVLIPASVENINAWAFYGSSRLATVTFEANSHLKYIGDVAFDATALSSITLPAPPVRAHYNFLGWSGTDQGSIVQNPATRVIQHQNLYALWQLSTYAVTFNSTLGSSVDSTEFQYGGSISAPTEPSRGGYTFSGWSTTEAGTAVTFPYSPNVDSAVTLYALWTQIVPTISTGSAPNSQLASIPAGLSAATLPATSDLPAVALAFATTTGSATATVTPIDNPASAAATPFKITSSTKIVDIALSGVTGPVTLCLDGAENDHIFHFTGGVWVELPQRTYANGQVCGVTESFSPFAAAELAPKTTIYTGPKITGRLDKVASTSGGSLFTITGDRLAQVTSVSLEGKSLAVVSKSESAIVVKLPEHTAGSVDVTLKSDSASLIYQAAIEFKEPVVVHVPVVTSKTILLASGSSKSISASDLSSVKQFVTSANAGAVLSCSVTYTSKADIQNAVALATAACTSAKKANSVLLTRVSAPVIVKNKSARKLLLSLTN
jgi:uncharacterized repeat protein (TIGR02543 family)